MKFINKNTIKLDKEINELDKFVFKFIKILERHTNYVVISGYVAILLGRSRSTEDIDVFIKEMDFGSFKRFYEELRGNSYIVLGGIPHEAIEDYKIEQY